MINLGMKLRSLRIEKHLTQQQVALRVGVSKAMISSYELGSRSPSYDILIKLARAFSVSTDFLLGVSKKRTIDTVGLSDHQIELLCTIAAEFRLLLASSI